MCEYIRDKIKLCFILFLNFKIREEKKRRGRSEKEDAVTEHLQRFWLQEYRQICESLTLCYCCDIFFFIVFSFF